MGSLAWLDAIRAASMDARPLEPPKKPAECHALDETMTIGPVVLHPIVVRQQMYIANGQTTTHGCSDQPQLYSLGQHHHNRPKDIQPPAFISLTWPRPSAAGAGGSLVFRLEWQSGSHSAFCPLFASASRRLFLSPVLSLPQVGSH